MRTPSRTLRLSLRLRTAAVAAALLASAAGAAWPQAVPVTPLDPFGLSRLKDFEARRESSNNIYVDSNDDSKKILPGETLVMADVEGPGIVTHMWITVAANEYAWPRLLRFRVYYDGSKTPSVDVPFGDFFASAHGYERNIDSLMIRNSSNGRSRNSYWPMPFQRRCRITVTNEGSRRVSMFYYQVDWQKHRSLSPDLGYFHAYYRQELPAVAGRPYEVLSVRGEGQLVGALLSVVQTEGQWFGEGDDLFYVDDSPTPIMEGTGTEDYFNDAWSLRVSNGLFTGVPIAEGQGTGARLSGYRWHLPDPVPFKKSLRFLIEHKGWVRFGDGAIDGFHERSDLWSSVAFWYQKGVNEGLPEPPYGPARLPHGNATQIEVENAIKDVKAVEGEATVERDVFWSKDILLLRAKGPGASFEVPFDAAADGFYEIVAQIAHAADYGDYTVKLDGAPVGGGGGRSGGGGRGREVRIAAYNPELYVAADHLIGWTDLSRGRHILTFTCAGRDQASRGFNLGIDNVVLALVNEKARIKR